MFCPTYQYEGQIVGAVGDTSFFCISLMTLMDSTMLGSFYYDELPSVTYEIGGTQTQKNFFEFGEFRNDSVVAAWKGVKSDDNKVIKGKRIDFFTGKEYDFYASMVFGKSYWDYIRKNRGYYEYTNLKKAVRHKHDVLSIDVERQGITHLPDKLACLDRIESINLLGNKIDTFPAVLAKMKTLDEISLSSNGMSYIGPEIGELTNLRILIINGNNLRHIPKEIGNLTNLLYLDISTNPIDSLPEEIKNLTKLQVLHIDNWQPSSERFSEEYKQHLQALLPNCRIHFDAND